MKIAINSPVWLRVPPVKYGGIEVVVDILANKLVELGFDVTLYASGDSVTNAKLRYVYDEPQGYRMHASLPELLHGVQVYKEAKNFDLIHDHTLGGPVFSSLVDTPVLVTLHGGFNEETKKYYSNFANDAYYNSISNYQQSCFPELNYVGTVYNAIDFSRYTFKEKKEDFILFLGRICHQKGTHLAIQAALRSNHRIIISGKIDPGEDSKYFEDKVKPLIDDKMVIYVGEASDEKKKELLSNAKCLLFPIQWAEPFGLVMVEALASGTPVIAFKNGSVTEIIEDRQTGFIVDNLEEMVGAIKIVDEIDSRICRQKSEKKFSPEKMASEYVKIYKKIVQDSGKKNVNKIGGRAVSPG
jgi:glycosyltransferase involved in cell wall biosynthesis